MATSSTSGLHFHAHIPLPAPVIVPQSANRTINELIEITNKDGDAYQVDIEVELNQAIMRLEDLAKDHFSSARNSLAFIAINLPSAHYHRAKYKALDSLMRLLDDDPINEETAHGIVDLVISIMKSLDREAIQKQIPEVQQRYARCYACVIEAILRHHSKNQSGNLIKELGAHLLATEKALGKLVQKDNIALQQLLQISKEGIKRLKTDNNVFLETFTRLSHLANAISNLVKKDLTGVLTELAATVKGLDDTFTSEWYDAFFACKELARKAIKESGTENGVAQVGAIQILNKHRMKKDWHYTYNAIEILAQIAAKSPSSAVRKAAILGVSADSEKYLGLVHFLSFKGFKTAGVALPSDKRHDLSIRRRTAELLVSFIKNSGPEDFDTCSNLKVCFYAQRFNFIYDSAIKETFSQAYIPTNMKELQATFAPKVVTLPSPIQPFGAPNRFALGESKTQDLPSIRFFSTSTSSTPAPFRFPVATPSVSLERFTQLEIENKSLAIQNENLMRIQAENEALAIINSYARVLSAQTTNTATGIVIGTGPDTRLRDFAKRWNSVPSMAMMHLGAFLLPQETARIDQLCRGLLKIPFSLVFSIPQSRTRHFNNAALHRFKTEGRLQYVRHLDLANTKVSDLRLLNGLALETLNLFGTPIRDCSLTHLEGMRLCELNVGATAITKPGFKCLSKLHLFVLNLWGTNLTDADLKELANMPFLHTLNLQNNLGISDSGLGDLANKPLRELHLERTKVTDRGLISLKKMPLEILNLRGTGIGNAGIKHLVGKFLKELNLEETLVTDKGLEAVATLSSLRVLNLWGTKISDNAAVYLARLRLENLNLGNTPFTDAGVGRCVRDMPLHSLDLYATKITDAVFTHLLGKKLRMLSLRSTAITTLRFLAGMPLNILNLSRTKIVNGELAYLAAMPLYDLNLRGTELTNDCLPHLARLPLRRLNITQTRINPDGVEWLRGQLHPACIIEF